jgi:signal transduction histidine kinase
MFETLQLLILGAAVVIDTALLLALAERANRRFVHVPLLLVTAGVWLWHTGLLALALALAVPAAAPLAPTLLLIACAGLLLMPCAMTHVLARLWRTGLAMRDRPDPRHLLAYLPMLALVALPGRLAPPTPDDLLAPLLPMVLPYLAWAGVVHVAAGITFLGLARRHESAPARALFPALAWTFLARTAFYLFVFGVAGEAWPAGAPALRLMAALGPIVPLLLLAYFVIRHDFLQLVVDRSLVYAGVLAGLALVHQLVLQDVSAGLPDGWRAALVFLEGAALATLVLTCSPLRRRSAEALRYLMGAAVARRRERLRQLGARMSAEARRPATELVDWFGAALREALEVDFVAGWLLRADGTAPWRWGEAGRLDDAAAARLVQKMCDAGLVRCARRDAPDAVMAAALHTAGASLAVLKVRHERTGLLLVGRHSRNRELNEEEASAVLLLVEQLAITLENGALEAERIQAERRAAQSEKLSALGLLASSIAHEVKNPLSAIKTIAAVLAEDLGADSPHAEDLRLIRGEIDRLAATTTQLLEFARPAAAAGRPGCVASALGGTLRLLRPLARQHGVTVECALPDTLPPVDADEPALREIFFNLLSNAVDAAGAGGRVVVTCTAEAGDVVAEVRDNGPGIPAEVRGRLFEPFLTTKANGTGLGLYAVGRHVRQLGGTIACTSAGGETVFTVRLPSSPGMSAAIPGPWGA